jgi:hypothetical protein
VTLMLVPAWYAPSAHPAVFNGLAALTLPPLPAVMDREKHCRKFALSVAAAAGMGNMSGRLLLTDTPLHPLNVKPLLGVASTVMEAPLTNEPAAHA